MQNAEGLDARQAFAYVNEQIDALAQEYLRMRETVLRGPLGRVPGIRGYLDEWGYAMTGNLRWSLITPRYNGSAHAWDGTTEGLGARYPERPPGHGLPGSAISHNSLRCKTGWSLNKIIILRRPIGDVTVVLTKWPSVSRRSVR